MRNASIAAIALALAPAIGLADVTSPSGKTVDCYCTDSKGERVELGQTICLFVDGKEFMALCDMSLNNPIWRKVSDGCLSSSAAPLRDGPASAPADG